MIALKLPEKDRPDANGSVSTPISESACLVNAVEALLFSTDAPASVSAIARALGALEGQVEQAIELLRERLNRSSGLEVVQIAGGYQLCTRPEYAELVAAFLKPQRNRLSRSLLEVLAIVAYNQPITLAEIDRVRGVQSDYSVRQLLERRLITEAGRKKAPGRPMLFATTQQFLHLFHLNDLSELPAVEQGLVVGGEPTADGD